MSREHVEKELEEIAQSEDASIGARATACAALYICMYLDDLAQQLETMNETLKKIDAGMP